MKSTKKTSVPRAKWLLSISAVISVASLICYAALAQSWHSGTLHPNSDADAPASVAPQTPECDPTPAPPPGNEEDPDLVKLHRQWIDRFLGLGSMSPAAYAEASAWARGLPLSPLTLTFAWQTLSPMWNDWGNGGCSYGCQKPFPPNSPCGSSSRVETIAVDPSNANGDIVYIGTEGGLSKSTNGGQDWNYLSDNLPSQSVRSIAIDPVAPNIVYAGTGVSESRGVGMYRSTNSGATWTIDLGVSQFSGKTVGKIAIDPTTAGSATSTTLYASITGSGSHSVWKSTNSGTTWTQIRGPTSGAGSFYDIAIDPGDPQRFRPLTIYVTAPNGLFKSTNGGTNWSTSIHPRGTPPVPSAPSYLAFIPSRLYLYIAFTENSHVTIDRSVLGTGWTDLSTHVCTPRPPPENEYCADATIGTFGVDPAHSNRIFVGGGGQLLYSLDSGANWLSPIDCPQPLQACVHVDMHSIAFSNGNPERSYLGTDGGIYRTDNSGTGNPIIWWSKNENLVGSLMYGISISSDLHMVQGNQDNGTQLGWNGRNPPWHHIYGGDGWKPRIDQTNSGRLYYVYYNGGTIQAGAQAPERVVLSGGNYVYTDVTPPEAITYNERSQFFPAMFAAPSDWNRVIMGFQNVYRSVDSGVNWMRIGGVHPGGIVPNGFAINALYEAPSNTDVIYATAGGLPFSPGSKVYVTSNAGQGNGATWTNRTSNLPTGVGIRAVTIHPTDYKTAYLACQLGVYKTTDSGISWTQRFPLGSYDTAIDPLYPEHVFAATDRGVYLSLDGGGSWGLTVGIPLGMPVTSLYFNAASRKLAASTYGRGAYVADLLGSARALRHP